MLKLRQISVALTLALVFCFTMLSSGAFAQSIEQGSPNITAAPTGMHSLTQQATSQQVNLQAATQNSAYDGWNPNGRFRHYDHYGRYDWRWRY